EPLCRGGRLGEVRIHRVHLEEDAAKLVHIGSSGRIHGSDASLVDFNRGGTPLAEIVTEPDLRSPEQAGEWLRLLRTTLRQLGVSDVNMEEGSLRCDANISVRPAGSSELGVKTELKNMNSFRFLERGIRAELARQQKLLASGAQALAFRAGLADYFEAALAAGADPAPKPQALANWITGELPARLPEGQDPADSRVQPAALAKLVGLLEARRVSVGAARQVLDR